MFVNIFLFRSYLSILNEDVRNVKICEVYNKKGKAITYDNNTNCVRLSYDSFPLFCSFNQKPPLLSAPHGK